MTKKGPLSREVEEEELRLFTRRDRDRSRRAGALGLDRRAVPRLELLAADLEPALHGLEPGVAAGRELVLHARAGVEAAGVEARVLVDRDRTVAPLGRGDQEEAAAALLVAVALLLVARRQAAPIGDDP